MSELIDVSGIVRLTGVNKNVIYNWLLRKSKLLLSIDPFPTSVNNDDVGYKRLWKRDEVVEWLEKTDILNRDPSAIKIKREFVIPHFPIV